MLVLLDIACLYWCPIEHAHLYMDVLRMLREAQVQLDLGEDGLPSSEYSCV